MDKNAAWINAWNLLKSEAQVDVFRDALSKLTKHEIENTNEEGQNLLHYAIAKNNLEVARILLEKDFFLPPHESETIPYLHLACFQGYSDMVELLVKKRPDDEFVRVSANDEHWKKLVASKSLGEDKKEALEAKISYMESKNEEISAFRVAALFQQKDCLINLIRKRSAKKWLSYMVEISEWDVMEFMLDAGVYHDITVMNSERSALNAALEKSLLLTSPRGLEVVLKYCQKYRRYLKLRNPFHFLYTFGQYGGWTEEDPVAECTRLLIRYGWDVNVMGKRPTFPLYCLLRHMMNYDDSPFREDPPHKLKTFDEELACFSELLAAGANPSFDERSNTYMETRFYSETRLESNLIGQFRDTQAFSSAAEALVALICSVTKCGNSRLMDFVSQSATCLVKYGCNLKGQRAWLGKMVDMDNKEGLKMLLNMMAFDKDALNYGFEKSLYNMSPSCLEAMLKYASENSVTFLQKDPLHFMYLSNWNEMSHTGEFAAECTRILINHGWNVNGVHAPASFPLYTLLFCVCALYEPENVNQDLEISFPEHVRSCFNVLLAAGADPNFNEMAIKAPDPSNFSVSAFEASLICELEAVHVGGTRRRYSSAAEVLMDIFNLRVTDLDFLGFIAESVILLVQHGWDVSYSDIYGETALHTFMGTVAAAYDYFETEEEEREAMKYLGSVMRSFLTSGADIHFKNKYSRLPLSYCIEWLADDISGLLEGGVELKRITSGTFKLFFSVLDVMEIEEAREAAVELMERIDENTNINEIDMTVLEGLKGEIESHMKVKLLYDSCLIKVWRYCGYKLAKIEALRLPWNIEQHFNDMLAF